jgi:hypothetical protein
MRVRQKDLAAAIFNPKGEEKDDSKKKDGVVVYTLYGKGDFKNEQGDSILDDASRRNNSDQEYIILAEERDNAYAKEVVRGGKARYFIKIGRNGRMFDPLAVVPSDARSYKRTHGTDEWTYREVNKRVFDLYLNYLRTKNNAWLHNAERENI